MTVAGVVAASTAAGCGEPAVAGLFYPDDPAELRAAVAQRHAGRPGRRLGTAGRRRRPTPGAVIAPHAGYRYSGPTAGAGWPGPGGRADGAGRRGWCSSGPAHRVPVGRPGRRGEHGRGPGGRRSATSPLDARRLPTPWSTTALAVVADDAHAPEHSLEVHLPFLLEVLGPVPVVPARRRAVPGRRRRPTRCDRAVGRRRDGRRGVVRPQPLPATSAEARARDERTARGHRRGPRRRHRSRGRLRAHPRSPGCCSRRARHGVAPSLARRGHLGRHGGRRRPGGRLRQRRLRAARRRSTRRRAGAGWSTRARAALVHEVAHRRARPARRRRGARPRLRLPGAVVRHPASAAASCWAASARSRPPGRCGATSCATPGPRRSRTPASRRSPPTTWPA